MDTLVIQAFAVAVLSYALIALAQHVRATPSPTPLTVHARVDPSVAEPVSEKAADETFRSSPDETVAEAVEAAVAAADESPAADAVDAPAGAVDTAALPSAGAHARERHALTQASPSLPSPPKTHQPLPSSPPSHAHAEDSPAKVAALQARVAGTISPALVDNADALRRVLRARRGHVSAAADMLGVTQEWRRRETPWWPASAIPLHMIDAAVRSGKAYIHGARDDGGPLLWVRVALHDKNEDRVALRRYIVAVNDECVARINAGAGSRPGAPEPQMYISVDFNGFGWAQFDTNAGITIVQTLSAHYPERLGRIVFFNTPFLFKAFWSVVKPFIDVRTAQKIVFLGDQKELATALGVPASVIPRWCGGTSDYVYDAAKVLDARHSEWASIREGPMPHLAPELRLDPHKN